MPESARRRFVFALISVAAAARTLTLGWLHPVTWDEIEYVRATRWVHDGLVPYRDFWEHHTPLQWFVFAPIAGLSNTAGVAAALIFRWAQVPLWIATFVLLSVWMRDANIRPLARAAALTLLICSSLFMLGAVEYRVDALGCALYVVALFCLQRIDRARGYAILAGAALCLAGFANLRLGPLLALTILVPRIVRPRDRQWGGRATANWIFAGAAATGVVCLTYFLATHSWRFAWQRAFVENYLGDRLAPGMDWVLLQRLVVPFGFSMIDPFRSGFEWAAVDVATILLFIVGSIGVIRVCIRRFRTPDELFLLAFFQVSSILFVCAMKYIHYYHFEIVLLLMVPFVAVEIDALIAAGRWPAVAFALVLATAVSLFASVFRGKEADMAYIDFVMREVDRQTTPAASVFDGVGWAIRRKPAYRYWFLPSLVQVMEARNIFEPYDATQMAAAPPAAIVADYRVFLWLRLHPALTAFATRHYLPVSRSLWFPGMSAVVDAARPSADWIVPASGVYRVYASDRLATHPWFRAPLAVGCFDIAPQFQVALTHFSSPSSMPLQWTVDGRSTAPETMRLERGQRLRVDYRASAPIGIVIVPQRIHYLFMQPPPGVGIDGFSPVRTHVPHTPDLWH
jgi:hypothetical protein